MERFVLGVCLASLLVCFVQGCPYWWCQPSEDPPPLEGYGADKDQISVSGVSSGGYMATQVHVAYSASIMGSGIVAAGPYHCAQGSTLRALQDCMNAPNNINVQQLVDFTHEKAQSGEIDPVSFFENGKTYLFSGSQDTTVDPGVMFKCEDYTRNFMADQDITTDYNIAAGHAMITQSYGNACSQQRMPYINNCNHPLAYLMMNHIYGGTLQKPDTYGVELPGDILAFDQTELEPAYSGQTSLDTVGFIYIPSGCRNHPGCKVHIQFHGCLQGRGNLDEEYVLYTGYNEVGELNNIIIIHPQVVSSMGNTNACWDWWGYTDQKYDLKDGVQMRFVKNIIDRVTSEHHACGAVRSKMFKKQCILPTTQAPQPPPQC
ncbi:poly(3-hydroxybutyrate) depolymerase-like [Ptychodera flava]|uniref:poly(3-hydroxybutyrate) depolymerase-like n=1 Tax=Ptychodera flava TaxID=63121 RepID=UPI00396A79E7